LNCDAILAGLETRSISALVDVSPFEVSVSSSASSSET
jgi:hypothetical protein